MLLKNVLFFICTFISTSLTAAAALPTATKEPLQKVDIHCSNGSCSMTWDTLLALPYLRTLLTNNGVVGSHREAQQYFDEHPCINCSCESVSLLGRLVEEADTYQKLNFQVQLRFIDFVKQYIVQNEPISVVIEAWKLGTSWNLPEVYLGPIQHFCRHYAITLFDDQNFREQFFSEDTETIDLFLKALALDVVPTSPLVCPIGENQTLEDAQAPQNPDITTLIPSSKDFLFTKDPEASKRNFSIEHCKSASKKLIRIANEKGIIKGIFYNGHIVGFSPATSKDAFYVVYANERSDLYLQNLTKSGLSPRATVDLKLRGKLLGFSPNARYLFAHEYRTNNEAPQAGTFVIINTESGEPIKKEFDFFDAQGFQITAVSNTHVAVIYWFVQKQTQFFGLSTTYKASTQQTVYNFTESILDQKEMKSVLFSEINPEGSLVASVMFDEQSELFSEDFAQVRPGRKVLVADLKHNPPLPTFRLLATEPVTHIHFTTDKRSICVNKKWHIQLPFRELTPEERENERVNPAMQFFLYLSALKKNREIPKGPLRESFDSLPSSIKSEFRRDRLVLNGDHGAENETHS